MKYFATLLLLVSTVAFAALVNETNRLTLTQVQGLSSEANTLSAEAPGLSATIADTMTNDVNYKKEAKVYIADHDQKVAQLAAAVANVMATVYHPAIDPITAESATYTAQCARTFNRETELDGYNRCVNWKSNLDAKSQQFNSWWTNYQVTWNAANTTPINAVIAKQNARLEQLNALSAQNATRYNEAIARFGVVKARIAEITGIISGFCHSETLSGEEMKWCNSVDWDGASRSLAPLDRTGTGGASRN